MQLEGSKPKVQELKKYGGQNGMINYEKLWSLLSQDLVEKKRQVTFRIENVEGQNALPPNISAGLPQQANPAVSILADSSSSTVVQQLNLQNSILGISVQPIKQQILGHYSKIPLNRERLIEHLMPGVSEIEINRLVNTVHNDMKELNNKDLQDLFKGALGDKKLITKSKLRDLLFDEYNVRGDGRSLSAEDQIGLVFNDLDLQGKSTITSQQLMQGCKHLGLNKSQFEIDQLFNDFKARDSQALSKPDFFRLIKHEFSKDIVHERVIKERLLPILDKADPFKSNELSDDQIK